MEQVKYSESSEKWCKFYLHLCKFVMIKVHKGPNLTDFVSTYYVRYVVKENILSNSLQVGNGISLGDIINWS